MNIHDHTQSGCNKNNMNQLSSLAQLVECWTQLLYQIKTFRCEFAPSQSFFLIRKTFLFFFYFIETFLEYSLYNMVTFGIKMTTMKCSIRWHLNFLANYFHNFDIYFLSQRPWPLTQGHQFLGGLRWGYSLLNVSTHQVSAP